MKPCSFFESEYELMRLRPWWRGLILDHCRSETGYATGIEPSRRSRGPLAASPLCETNSPRDAVARLWLCCKGVPLLAPETGSRLRPGGIPSRCGKNREHRSGPPNGDRPVETYPPVWQSLRKSLDHFWIRSIPRLGRGKGKLPGPEFLRVELLLCACL